MGFTQVYDYSAGKKSWGAFGLPREGRVLGVPSGGELARGDVPTCALSDDLAGVRERVRAAGWETCIVVNEERVVVGRLGRRAIRSDDDSSVEDAMTEGPQTYRPSIEVSDLVERMRKHDLRTSLITTPDGRLIGLVLRSEAEALLAK
jgi:predicted transcriptional regulator